MHHLKIYYGLLEFLLGILDVDIHKALSHSLDELYQYNITGTTRLSNNFFQKMTWDVESNGCVGQRPGMFECDT